MDPFSYRSYCGGGVNMNFTIETPAQFIEPVVCVGINMEPYQYFILVLLAAFGIASIVGFFVDRFMRKKQGIK